MPAGCGAQVKLQPRTPPLDSLISCCRCVSLICLSHSQFSFCSLAPLFFCSSWKGRLGLPVKHHLQVTHLHQSTSRQSEVLCSRSYKFPFTVSATMNTSENEREACTPASLTRNLRVCFFFLRLCNGSVEPTMHENLIE